MIIIQSWHTIINEPGRKTVFLFGCNHANYVKKSIFLWRSYLVMDATWRIPDRDNFGTYLGNRTAALLAWRVDRCVSRNGEEICTKHTRRKSERNHYHHDLYLHRRYSPTWAQPVSSKRRTHPFSTNTRFHQQLYNPFPSTPVFTEIVPYLFPPIYPCPWWTLTSRPEIERVYPPGVRNEYHSSPPYLGRCLRRIL